MPHIGQLGHRPPDMRFLSFEEAARLAVAAELPLRTMVATALDTGIRIGELVALRWENLNLEAKSLR